MALSNVWWMQDLQPTATQVIDPSKPHLAWPANCGQVGISFHTLETYLHKHRNDNDFSIHKFTYTSMQWSYTQTLDDMRGLIKELKTGKRTSSNIFIMTKPCPEAVRALGHYLHITPRFFNFPYVPTSTGNHVAGYAFFHLQFMDMYPPKIKPSEAARNQNSPYAQFNLGQGLTQHTWHITKVDLIYWNEKIESTGSNRGMGLISLDPADVIIYKGLRKLMTRKETIPPGKWEEEFGLGQVLSEMFHIISVNWNAFLDEAEQHLQHISRTITTTATTHEQQKSYSLALHQLSPLWSEVRRRIVSAKDTAQQMTTHPFFIAVGGEESISSYLKKIILTLNDYETRTHELDTNTNILINLIFNLATFTDTAAAIQESKAANYLAASIRRVAMLTFFYLPLQVAASIYGMNIYEITGGDGDHHIWEYALLSLILMGLTCLFWYAWKAIPRLFGLRNSSRRQSLSTGSSPV